MQATDHHPPTGTPHTDPTLLAEITTALDSMNDTTKQLVEKDAALLGHWPDDLAEIFEYHYEPGAIKTYARHVTESGTA